MNTITFGTDTKPATAETAAQQIRSKISASSKKKSQTLFQKETIEALLMLQINQMITELILTLRWEYALQLRKTPV